MLSAFFRNPGDLRSSKQ